MLETIFYKYRHLKGKFVSSIGTVSSAINGTPADDYSLQLKTQIKEL